MTGGVVQAGILTAIAPERDRSAGRFVADALLDALAAHGVETAAVMRGALGVGRDGLRTDRRLTAAEDLPAVVVAVDAAARVAAAATAAAALLPAGILTREGALLADPPTPEAVPADATEARLTLVSRRAARIAGRPAHIALVELLRRHGAAGATVLAPVDGLVRGARARASLRRGNGSVPVLVVSIAAAGVLRAALADIGGLPEPPLAYVERVRVLRRDGAALQPPSIAPPDAPARLTVISGALARCDGRPLHEVLVERVVRAGAPGATAVRGVHGYHGEHAPHGDRLLAVRRRVPVVTTVVGPSALLASLLPVVAEVTATTGLVTLEAVPAAAAGGAAAEIRPSAPSS